MGPRLPFSQLAVLILLLRGGVLDPHILEMAIDAVSEIDVADGCLDAHLADLDARPASGEGIVQGVGGVCEVVQGWEFINPRWCIALELSIFEHADPQAIILWGGRGRPPRGNVAACLGLWFPEMVCGGLFDVAAG